MYEEVEDVQKKYLPSEDDLPNLPAGDKLAEYHERHTVVKRGSYKDQGTWDDLGDKAMTVYKDCLDDDDNKVRLKTADTVMEVLGKKGQKNDKGSDGMTIVFSDKALEKLQTGLSTMFQKDVTRNESFKISPGSDAE